MMQSAQTSDNKDAKLDASGSDIATHEFLAFYSRQRGIRN